MKYLLLYFLSIVSLLKTYLNLQIHHCFVNYDGYALNRLMYKPELISRSYACNALVIL